MRAMSPAELCERGWTKKMIRRFAGHLDVQADGLYSAEHIERIETSKKFRDHIARRNQSLEHERAARERQRSNDDRRWANFDLENLINLNVLVAAAKAVFRRCPSCTAAFPDMPARPRKCRACGVTIVWRDKRPLAADHAAALDRENQERRDAEERERARPKFTIPEIRGRGWTDAMIRRFLPAPDATYENPRYKSAAPGKLYLVDRVEAIEATAEFKDARAAAEKRSGVAKARLAAAREAARHEAEQRRVAELEEARKIREARERLYRERYQDRRSTIALSAAADKLFALNRLAKHPGAPRERIYALKNQILEVFWNAEYCIAAALASSPSQPCYGCDGYGTEGVDNFEVPCDRCGGTGVFRPSEQYWALRFLVGETIYSWHQPAELAPWASPLGEPQPHDVIVTTHDVDLGHDEIEDAIALLEWVLGRDPAPDEPPQAARGAFPAAGAVNDRQRPARAHGAI